MPRAPDQGRLTHDKLLATTEAMLVERGWEATTVQAIQRRAAVSQGSWAYAFPNGKVQAGIEIYDRIHREFWPGALEPFEHGGRRDAATAIGRSLAQLFAYAAQNPLRFRLLMSLEHILLQAKRTDVVRAHQAGIEQMLASWGRRVLDPSPDDGQDLGRMLRPIVFSAALAMLHDGPVAAAASAPDRIIDALAAAAWTGVQQLVGRVPAKSPKAARSPPSATDPELPFP